MASAVLASRNESSSWAMGKIPYHHHINPNPNPNPNPKKKQKQFHHANGRYQNNNFDSPVVTQTASDDAYSFNQTSTSRNGVNYGASFTLDFASYSKFERLELKQRLSSELDRIRELRDRIDGGQLINADVPRSQPKSKKFGGNKRLAAGAGSVPKTVGNNNGFVNGGAEAVDFGDLLKECGKIVAKLLKNKSGYVFKAPVDAKALKLIDYHDIVKHPMDLGTVKANLAKNLYRTPAEFAADVRLTFNNAMTYNPTHDPVHGMADNLLKKFEEMFAPVQEQVDSRLAEQRRESDFREYSVNEDLQFRSVEELQRSSWGNPASQIAASPVRGKKMKPKASPVPVAQVMKKLDRLPTPMQAHSSASTPSHPPPPLMSQPPLMSDQMMPSSPVRAPTLPAKEPKGGRGSSIKQPKPRAKDPNKRDMSMEEKQKLGLGLQSLPQEKMPQLVQIIRKRNEQLAQDGDEIELDIEALDTETLWELDRFVTNWKKMVSKTKRQSLMGTNPPSGVAAPSTPIADVDMGALSDKNDDGPGKKFKDDDEDVDIDDDMPETSFPPVEIEKDEGIGAGVGGVLGNDDNRGNDGNHGNDGNRGNDSSSSSSSGSSSSDSSSSSGSDSGSSSGSDSDADDAQS